MESTRFEALPTREVRISRHNCSHASRDELDTVATEVPVALSFNGISHAVMMATPADLEEFGFGFALSEGIIEAASQCHDLDVMWHPRGCEISMRISQRQFAALKAKRRSLEGRTGCGLCGVDSLDAIDVEPSSVTRHSNWRPARADDVMNALRQLHDRQPLNSSTGGCHAAAWAGPNGELRVVKEDVGRHNALDKLIGSLARMKLLGTPGFALVTSRASFELVRKCARVGIPALAAISAPSSLAIDIAVRADMQLFAFCRGSGAVCYSGVDTAISA